jgi:hypothetical protein
MKRSYWASVFFGGGADFSATVRALEERGLTGVEVPQVYGPPFAPLAVAATVTMRIQLASGIAIGLTTAALLRPQWQHSTLTISQRGGLSWGWGPVLPPVQN